MAMQFPKSPVCNSEFAKQGLKDVLLLDVISANNLSSILVKIIEKNSEYKQGVRIGSDGKLEINNVISPSFELWEDTAPAEVMITLHEVSSIIIYNIWDCGDGKDSQSFTSGMLKSKSKNVISYKCNDFGIETHFDKLHFQITLLMKV